MASEMKLYYWILSSFQVQLQNVPKIKKREQNPSRKHQVLFTVLKYGALAPWYLKQYIGIFFSLQIIEFFNFFLHKEQEATNRAPICSYSHTNVHMTICSDWVE